MEMDMDEEEVIEFDGPWWGIVPPSKGDYEYITHLIVDPSTGGVV